MNSSILYVIFSVVGSGALFLAVNSIYVFRVYPHIFNQPNAGQIIKVIQSTTILVAVIYVVVIGLVSWIVSHFMQNELTRLKKEIEQVAIGNTDVEIHHPINNDIAQITQGLEKICAYIKQSRIDHGHAIEEKTKELTKKITDLEKLKDLTNDSILLAKRMQQERDELKDQLIKRSND